MPQTRGLEVLSLVLRDKRRFPDDVHTIFSMVVPERVDTSFMSLFLFLLPLMS